MILRRFNEKGIESFDQFRASTLRNVGQLHEILEAPAFSSAVVPNIEVEQRIFSTRFEAGEYLYSLFNGASVLDIDADRGLWSWLAAFYFEQLSLQGGPPTARPRWIPENTYDRYYRHLLRAPYQIYRAHSDKPHRALVVLATPPNAPGELAEQLVARQDLITNPHVMEVATSLYIDPATNRPKRGAGRRDNGGARRFPIVLDQLDLTWDLYRLDPDKLLALLPAEFDQFKP